MRRSPWPLLILLASACQPKPEDLIETLEIVGCRDLRKGPICEIDGPTKLVIWVKVKEGAKVAIKTDHGPSAVKFHPYEDGYRTRFIATATAGAVIVEARRKGIDTRRWPLELHEKSELLKEAERLQSEGKEAEAKEKWELLKDSKEPREAAEAFKQRGAAHGRRGEIAEARKYWGASAEVAAKAGLVARTVNEQMSIAQTCIDGDRDLVVAEETLNSVKAALLPEDALGAIHLQYYRGALAMRIGDLRRAEAAARQARASAGRLERSKTAWAATLLVAQVLGQEGRYPEWKQTLEALKDHPVSRAHPCNAALIQLELGWATAMAAEAGGEADAQATAIGAQARQLYLEGCPDKSNLGNATLNLALMALQAGALAPAKAWLQEAARLDVQTTLERRLWYLDLQARLALQTGEVREALRLYRSLGEEAQGSSPAAGWRASAGVAAALARLGQEDEALDEYRKAAALLRDEAIAVGLDGGRAHFLASRRRTTSAELELLLKQGRTAEALLVAREARAGLLAGLTTSARIVELTPGARTEWAGAVEAYRSATREIEHLADAAWGQAATRARSAATQEALLGQRRENLLRALDALGLRPRELSKWALGPSEIALLYTPLDATRWLAFAQTSKALKAQIITLPRDLGDLGAVGQSCLSPFDGELAEATEVRLLVEGRLAQADLHAAHWRERPLVASKRVRFSIDYSGPAQDVQPSKFLIVADPSGDLPEAREEGTQVQQRVAAHWPTQVLLGQEATRSAVLRAFAASTRFHFAGHGEVDPTGGLESLIRLASDTAITAGEILTQPHLPKEVVLSSCEVSGTAPLPAQQLGLAQAFVVGGAHQVVAPSRAIPDGLARAFINRLYRVPTDPLDVAYHRAITEIGSESPQEDWASFRLITP